MIYINKKYMMMANKKDISKNIIPIVSKIKLLKLSATTVDHKGNSIIQKCETIIPLNYNQDIHEKKWFNNDTSFKMNFREYKHPTFYIPLNKEYSLVYLVSSHNAFKQIQGNVENVLGENKIMKDLFGPIKNINKPQLIKNDLINKYFSFQKNSTADAINIISTEENDKKDVFFKLVRIGIHSLISTYDIEEKININVFDEKIFNMDNAVNIIGGKITKNVNINDIFEKFENTLGQDNPGDIGTIGFQSIYKNNIEDLVKLHVNKNYIDYINNLDELTNDIISHNLYYAEHAGKKNGIMEVIKQFTKI